MLMECLPPTVSYLFLWIAISHLLVFFPTLELTTFEQQVWSKKIGYANHGKGECGYFEQRISNKRSSVNLAVVGLNDNREVYIISSKFSEPKRCVQRLNKVGGSIFKNNNQINCTVTNRAWVCWTEWTITFSSIRMNFLIRKLT